MTDAPPMPHISILTSLYYSEPFIEELYTRTCAVLSDITDDYEFVFVDDGSPDNGVAKVKELIERDTRVRCVELSRNFGHHQAVVCGLEYSRGDYVFLFDSDLDEPPELLKTFYDAVMENPEEIDVVYGKRKKRTGSLFYRLSGTLHYKVLNSLSYIHVPENQITARLMSRRYVDALLQFPETNVYLAGIMVLAGFRQVGVPVEKVPKGHSTYTLRRKLGQVINAILTTSNRPLTYIASLGLVIAILALLAASGLAVRLVIQNESVEGWLIVLASLWFLGGLIIFSIGVVGVYVGRTFLQVKNRPRAIVKRVHN